MRRTFESVLRALPLTAGLVLLGGCPRQPAEDQPPIHVGADLQAEYVVANAANPTVLVGAQDGRIFYGEKSTGQIRVIKDGVPLDEPFAAVPVNSAGERGLLGLALHPAFVTNGRVYAFYSRSDTGESTNDPQAIVDHRVVYFEPAEKGGDVSSGAEVFVASFPTASALTRIGGRIAFAADRTLLVALGDMEDPESAQDPALPLGKVLRYRDDGTIPADNPSPDSAVFASGFCDPRGLTIDPQSEAPFLTERSADSFNEINRLQSGSSYGWPVVAGFADTPDELAFVAEHPEYGDPLVQSHSAYAGAAFNPGGKYGPGPRLQLFYGVSDRAQVVRLGLSLERTASLEGHTFASGFPSAVTDVAFTPAGTLYVACTNAVLRIMSLDSP